MKCTKRLSISLLVVPLLTCAACRSPYYADRGAAMGGVAGGLAGAALGDRSNNALGGALIGTAVGALSGAAIGDSMDAEVERRQALIEAKVGRRMSGAVTTSDVMTMSRSGLGDEVIINHVRANGMVSQLTPNDIIQMHENGVSERVINAMQQMASTQVVAPPAAYSAPIIIEESYMVPPPYWRPRPYCYGPGPYHHHYRRAGASWGFSYSR
ncbi:MAG: glycine zipper domain-containing protein [Pirellulaceae bacterium]